MSTDKRNRQTGLYSMPAPDSGYGFFFHVFDASGKPVPEYQGDSGVFASAEAVKPCAESGRHGLWKVNQTWMSFLIRDSLKHGGKKEAHAVQKVEAPTELISLAALFRLTAPRDDETEKGDAEAKLARVLAADGVPLPDCYTELWVRASMLLAKLELSEKERLLLRHLLKHKKE